jgi:2-polyprenyl-3-methyl-5-hydroxy-6-metoxy-1,4-benzoquinol methylase
MTFPETLDEAVREAVRAWSAGAEYHFHTLEEAGEAALLDEMRAAMAAARDTVARCAEGLAAGSRPGAVLEVGCSIGVKLVALAEHFAGAEVRGLDPEASALAAARALATQSGHAIELDQGVGEALPYADGRFDLVLCHTVIEHVADVDACIAEMARVLKPGGVLHLEAPNYIWPFEPHLGIWMPPLCPKPLMRALARLQGKGDLAAYADHLKLVHPSWLERAFRHNGLEWENRFAAKLRAALAGNLSEVANYRRLARLLAALGRTGLARPLVALVVALGLYPSVIYTARKPE